MSRRRAACSAGVIESFGTLAVVADAACLAASCWLLARSRSGVSLVGGIVLAVGMACFVTTRGWIWLPLLVDPCGLVAFSVSVAWRRR